MCLEQVGQSILNWRGQFIHCVEVERAPCWQFQLRREVRIAAGRADVVWWESAPHRRVQVGAAGEDERSKPAGRAMYGVRDGFLAGAWRSRQQERFEMSGLACNRVAQLAHCATRAD
jgi:hypothetical protein